jgi:Flp pilus assembly protein TadG
LWKATAGSITTEFALVLPLLIIFLLGTIDAGRFLWTWNRAEKATQMGVRYAAATDMVAGGLASYDFYSEGIPRGDPIPQTSFGGATCTSTGCTCISGEVCPDLGALSTVAYTNTVARMQAFMPGIQPANVVMRYDYSGIGYSGDPYGPDVNPLITVSLVNMTFRPSLAYLFGGTLSLPPFASTLTMEDGTGAISN